MTPLIFTLEEESQVGFARRGAARMAEEQGFDERQTGCVALVVTEIASNVIRHARSGHLFLRKLETGDAKGLEILSIDRGPGFPDSAPVFEDGVSTCGGAGMGLGAIVRLSTVSDFYSMPGRGLAVLSQLWFPEPPRDKFLVGAIAVPYPGENICGDSWFAAETSAGMVLFLADGLGHGPLAAEASQATVEAVRGVRERSPEEILKRVQDSTAHTRGSVAFAASIDLQEGCLLSSGFGNIDARIISTRGEQKHLLSQQGTLGTQVHLARRFRANVTEWSQGDVLCLASDGLSVRWQPEEFPGLFSRHPSLISGILWRECGRGTDDASILVCKERRISG